MSGEPVERFQPTSGRIMGLLALAAAVGVVVLGLVDRESGSPPPVMAGAVAGGILVWAAMLRPRVWATHDDLVMRNMLHSVSIPLAAIEQVAVRQVLAVSAGEKRYVSPAIGKSWRQAVRSDGAPREPAAVQATHSYPDFVQERISRLAEDARARLGVSPLSDEQVALASGVRRTWAWPEIAGLAAATAALVVLLVV
jgi:hypothetical protein